MKQRRKKEKRKKGMKKDRMKQGRKKERKTQKTSAVLHTGRKNSACTLRGKNK